MPLYRVTVTRIVISNGLRLESGMQVEVLTQAFTNPVFVNGGKDVIAAFQRVYGIDVSRIFTSLKTAPKVDKIG